MERKKREVRWWGGLGGANEKRKIGHEKNPKNLFGNCWKALNSESTPAFKMNLKRITRCQEKEKGPSLRVCMQGGRWTHNRFKKKRKGTMAPGKRKSKKETVPE